MVNDVYNASPASMGAALATLATLDVAGRRVAVLGDMYELGPQERAMHAEVGRKAATTLDLLVTVGDLASEIARGAREAGMAGDRVVHVPAAERRRGGHARKTAGGRRGPGQGFSRHATGLRSCRA